MDQAFTTQLVPLVVVAGLEPDSTSNPGHIFPVDSVELISQRSRSSVARTMRRKLASRSHAPGPWQPPFSTVGFPQLHIRFSDTVDLCSRTPKPSILSPANPESPLYPSGVFTSEWFNKYLYFMPGTIAICFDVSEETDTESLANQILAVHQNLAPHGVHLVIVLIGSEIELTRLVSELRRSAGLPPRIGLLTLAEDYNDSDVDAFVDTLWTLLGTDCAEFFGQRLMETRRKRNVADNEAASLARSSGSKPELEIGFLVADARYTLKMGCFAEFAADGAAALKLWESAYDSVLLLFDNDLGPDAPGYSNARLVLDLAALRIFQNALAQGNMELALKKFRIHLSSVSSLCTRLGLPQSRAWQADQYMHLASLFSLIDAPPGRAGLLYLDAAKMALRPQTRSGRPDPYLDGGIGVFDPGPAFLGSISNLVGLPNARAYALSQYADWKSRKGDSDAATEAYKSAWALLQPSAAVVSGFRGKWSKIETYLAGKLLDAGVQEARAILWRLGRLNVLDVTPEAPLFEARGTFISETVYIGRSLGSQVTLDPLFMGTLVLEKVRVRFSVAQIEIRHEEGSQDRQFQVLETSQEANGRLVATTNLKFSGKDGPRTFELAVDVSEPGDLEIIEVEVSNGTMLQRLAVEPASEWITGLPLSARTRRHMRLLEPRRAIIETRPAQLDVVPETPDVAAPGENLAYLFHITNLEKESVSVEVAVINSELQHENKAVLKLAPSETQDIHGILDNIPAHVFSLQLLASYATSADRLPVRKEIVFPVEVLRPFRVTFDLLPEFQPGDWPSFFATSGSDKSQMRRWRLVPTILAFPRSSDSLILHNSVLHVESNSDIDVIDREVAGPESGMGHNALFKTGHAFICSPKTQSSGGMQHSRSIDAKAHLELRWSRPSTPGLVNTMVVAPVQLSLPSQEPRVLVVTAPHDPAAPKDSIKVHYWVENATSHVLTFAVSMASCPYFAFQGPKSGALRLLPYSRRCYSFTLIPLGSPVLRGMRPLPEFRVFDTGYKRTLAVQPGDRRIFLEQGSLLV